MNRTELMTEILKLTGHKRSLHPNVNFGIQRLLDKYEKGLKAGQHETIVNCPKPFTAEFLTYLLINALRNLNERQRHNLALSLAVRDPLFSIEEYEEQLGN